MPQRTAAALQTAYDDDADDENDVLTYRKYRSQETSNYLAITTYRRHPKTVLHIVQECRATVNEVVDYYTDHIEGRMVTIDAQIAKAEFQRNPVNPSAMGLQMVRVLNRANYVCSIYTVTAEQLQTITGEQPQDSS